MALILVAEDDRTVSHLLCSTLRGAGHETIAAFDAMQTLMYAMRTPRPEAILLDIQMPGGTGREALRKIRGSTKTMMIPVLILSGTTDPDERQAVEALGVSASLSKPVDLAALLAELGRAIGSG